MLEGRSWGKIVIDKFGAKVRSHENIQINKFYLYQLYTTAFFEFDSLEKLKECREYLDEADPYWDYDPIATLDTSDEDTIKRWIKQ